MDTQVFYLEAQTAFHLGERGVGIEETNTIAHADTIFSALCTVCREWYGVDILEQLLSAFRTDRRNPPFLITSAFPYISLPDRVIRLFPRPLGIPPGAERYDPSVLKQLKGVAYVSEAIFLGWVKAEPSLLKEMPQENPGSEHLLHEGQVWVTHDEAAALAEASIRDAHERPWLERDIEGHISLWKEHTVPRVTLDRITNASTIYQAGRVHFAQHAGLWLGFHWRSQTGEWQQRLAELLHVLADSGLGGERSAGHGQFSVAGDETISLPEPGQRSVTLAPYWPCDPDEARSVTDGEAAYNLLVRRGWMGSPDGGSLRRKAVRMLGEGSILSNSGSLLLGGLADVTPEVFTAHAVWRYGYAFPIGIQ